MINNFIKKYNLPKYRDDQFQKAYYQESIGSWDELTTWPISLREDLKKEIPFSTIEDCKEKLSSDKRTRKLLSYTKDNHPIETVLIKSTDRNTVCVSCMSGCPVGCKFCATGQMGFNRNLDSREIIDQIMYFKRILKRKNQNITNIVFMGMGEPMLNLDNVVSAIKILTDPMKLGFSHRRITVSTAGYIQELKKFLDMNLGVKIAISLHAPNQSLREKIMPTVSKNNHLEDLITLLIEYQKKRNKRVTYEYLLLKDFNDRPEDAKELAKLLKNQVALVNLINFNPSDGIAFSPSKKKDIENFRKILESREINNTLRYSFGGDIDAACGQLAKIF
ncbi:MAG: 23S rRNA (adenine(2503)-C(2))-methyltransferase RlmN [Candidatus Dojkabacteria bacterium]